MILLLHTVRNLSEDQGRNLSICLFLGAIVESMITYVEQNNNTAIGAALLGREWMSMGLQLGVVEKQGNN